MNKDGIDKSCVARALAIFASSFLLPLIHLAAAEGTTNSDSGGALTSASSAGGAVTNTKPLGATRPESADGQQTNEFGKGVITLRLMESLKADQKRLEDILERLNDPEGEVSTAEEAVNETKTQAAQLKARLTQMQKQGQAPSEELKSEQTSLEKKLELAQARFATALEERKALQDQSEILQKKIGQDKAILARLTGEATAPATNQVSAGAAETRDAQADTNTPAPASTLPAIPGPMGMISQSMTAPEATNAPPLVAPSATATQVMTMQLREAKQEELEKKAQADRAVEGLRLVQEKIILAEKELEADAALQATARKRLQGALGEKSALDQELQQKLRGSAPIADLDGIRARIQDSEERIRQAQSEITEYEKLLIKQRSDLEQLKRLEGVSVKAADDKREAATSAHYKVRILESPLHPRNLLRWLVERGPAILGTLLAMFAASALVTFLCRRTVKLLVRKGSRGTFEERENRGRTLISVFRSTATTFIFIGGILLILDEAGVPVGPLLGGAAIIGLALAFGAQRLFADFFHGFVMILENQYKVNDIIRVAGISGVVERISMRITVIRDVEGILHFIPNSEIKTVSNMTHGWSRAAFEIGVAYKEDTDRVMDILCDLGQEMRKDERFGPLILEDLQMLGVDALADSAIVIKFLIKTQPFQQWAVKREMLRRIKRRFDELGIEIPFPHYTVLMRTESGAPLQADKPPPATL